MTLQDLAGKKIAIAGLGVNNRKMADYFSAHGIAFQAAEHWADDADLTRQLAGAEVIFRTPGLPYFSAPIQAALKAGVTISSQTKLFFALCPCPIIGVTGTKGKGTTSSLIAAILRTAGRAVSLGGNIGRDPFEFLDDLTPRDLVVLELSSFQLQDLTQSPHAAVVLGITPDHLDYHRDMAEYIAAKSAIIKFQTPADFAVLSRELPADFASLGQGQKNWIDPSLAAPFPTRLIGAHNQENLAAAIQTARRLGVDEASLRRAVAEFSPLPHRLEPIGQVRDINFVDDSYGTNIESTLAAIDAVETGVVLIVGGFDKGFSWAALGDKIKNNPRVRGLVVIGQVAAKIQAAVQGFTGPIRVGAPTMKEIVAQALTMAKPGDTILLSPGTSSFDMFQSATDRAEQFLTIVNALRS